ncbi:hypothetical protein ACQKQA_26505 [Pseudomonas sp. NPDC089530]|uniref:hypothetical protein n=1 Tax=Pseudomonas sp. NPDC089530 TaxID=3390651 RepID=UPI003D085348
MALCSISDFLSFCRSIRISAGLYLNAARNLLQTLSRTPPLPSDDDGLGHPRLASYWVPDNGCDGLQTTQHKALGEGGGLMPCV